MNPRHHLDPSTIVAYAAGAVAPEFAVVVATHLATCGTCRRRIAGAEQVGGLLLEQRHADYMSDQRRLQLREAMSLRLSEPVAGSAVDADSTQLESPAPFADADRLPLPLQPYFGATFSGLKWRWVAPGIHSIQAPDTQRLILLKVAPGRSLPLHTHEGNELTQILRGAYHDELGQFAAGDVADLDVDIEHRPVTAAGVPCICACALDAPLRFSNRLIQALQPLFRL